MLHAPRQTGKTSCLLALRDYLNERGDYIAVYANVEGGQASRNDVQSVIKSTVDTLAEEMRGILKNNLPLQVAESVQQTGKDAMLATFLRRLSESLPRPLVLFIDEIDALVGDSLVSVLRQLRAGYPNRPAAFLRPLYSVAFATFATIASCSPTRTSSPAVRLSTSRPSR